MFKINVGYLPELHDTHKYTCDCRFWTRVLLLLENKW